MGWAFKDLRSPALIHEVGWLWGGNPERRSAGRRTRTAMKSRVRLHGLFCLIVFFLPGCSGPLRRDAVPAAYQNDAGIPGMPGIRYSPAVTKDVKAMAQEGVESFYREKAFYTAHGVSGRMPPAVYLAISGGGDKGAFGAGLLAGWTAAGDRPRFKLVTGVSTGALIAPFAFLGSAYDRQLRDIYTGVSQADILEPRSLTAALWDDAMADNRPLWHLLEKHIDMKMLKAIAEEYKKGRLLLIATTNLDSELPVIWNLTRIAASGHPKSLELIRSLMIASAAIPGAFPPVLIDVEAHGHSYQEMHVDGGASTQVFLYPPSLQTARLLAQRNEQRERRLYIIRNARLDHEWAQVNRRTLPIIQRAISSLIQSQGLGDLYRMYLTARQDDLDYHLAFIDSSFSVPHAEDFNREFMRRLWDFGYQAARKGYPWRKVPPGINADSL